MWPSERFRRVNERIRRRCTAVRTQLEERVCVISLSKDALSRGDNGAQGLAEPLLKSGNDTGLRVLFEAIEVVHEGRALRPSRAMRADKVGQPHKGLAAGMTVVVVPHETGLNAVRVIPADPAELASEEPPNDAGDLSLHVAVSEKERSGPKAWDLARGLHELSNSTPWRPISIFNKLIEVSNGASADFTDDKWLQLVAWGRDPKDGRNAADTLRDQLEAARGQGGLHRPGDVDVALDSP